MSRLAIVILVPFLLVGCTRPNATQEPIEFAEDQTPPTPVASPTPPAPRPTTPTPSPPPPGVSPSPTPTTPSPTTAPSAPPPPPPQDVTRTFLWNTTLAPGAAACVDPTVAPACGLPAPTRVSEDVGGEGGLVRAGVVVNWTAQVEALATLRVDLLTCDQTACASVASVTGASPLAIELPDGQLRGNARLVVSPANALPEAPATLDASAGASISATGAFVLRPLPPGSPGFAGHDG